MTNAGADKILIVDDTPNNVKLLKDLLSFHDYDVRTASSGADPSSRPWAAERLSISARTRGKTSRSLGVREAWSHSAARSEYQVAGRCSVASRRPRASNFSSA